MIEDEYKLQKKKIKSAIDNNVRLGFDIRYWEYIYTGTCNYFYPKRMNDKFVCFNCNREIEDSDIVWKVIDVKDTFVLFPYCNNKCEVADEL